MEDHIRELAIRGLLRVLWAISLNDPPGWHNQLIGTATVRLVSAEADGVDTSERPKPTAIRDDLIQLEFGIPSSVLVRVADEEPIPESLADMATLFLLDNLPAFHRIAPLVHQARLINHVQATSLTQLIDKLQAQRSDTG